jgi:hypothetical protein
VSFAQIKKAQEDLVFIMNKVQNFVKIRATEVPIKQIVHLANVALSLIKQCT